MRKINLFLEFTHLCNYKCVFCENRTWDKRVSINLEEIKSLDHLLEIANWVDITGSGEFLMHPNRDKILDYFIEKQTPIRLVTNGWLLQFENIREKLRKLNWFDMAVSLNSLRKDTYEKLTGSKDFDKVLEGFLEWKKILPTVAASFVINAKNFDEISDILDFSKKNHVYCSLMGLTPTIDDFYTKDLVISPDIKNKSFLSDMKKRIVDEHIPASLFSFATQEKTDRHEYLKTHMQNCRWVYDYFFVLVNGDVHTCCWNHEVLGNIKNQTFEEIWNGEPYTNLRNNIKNGIIGNCKNCRGL